MSVRLSKSVISPAENTHLEDAWALKEQLRREENIFKQNRDFFEHAYTRATDYCYHDEEADVLAGFAAARADGYMLFLAVHPEYRHRGLGRDLVDLIQDQHGKVTCHVRTTNENAIQFYTHVGFEKHRRITNYYQDGGDAFYMIKK